METKFRDANPDVIKTDLLVLPVQEKNLEGPAVRALNRRLKGKLSEQIQRSKFTGAEGSSLSYSTAGTLPASHLLLIGFGKANDVTSDTWRRAGAKWRRCSTAKAILTCSMTAFVPTRRWRTSRSSSLSSTASTGQSRRATARRSPTARRGYCLPPRMR